MKTITLKIKPDWTKGMFNEKWQEINYDLHHSPTGINWWYWGSWPADCARNVIKYLLWINFIKQPIIYQTFKEQFIAKFNWTEQEVKGWYIKNFKK